MAVRYRGQFKPFKYNKAGRKVRQIGDAGIHYSKPHEKRVIQPLQEVHWLRRAGSFLRSLVPSLAARDFRQMIWEERRAAIRPFLKQSEFEKIPKFPPNDVTVTL